MRIANVNPDLLAPGWLVHWFPARLKPEAHGLSGVFFVKGTWRMKHDADCVPFDKPEFASGDVPVEENPALGVAYASDFVPYKPKPDFVVAGHAYPPGGSSTTFPVAVRVGEQTKQIAVVGDRKWGRSLLGAMPGKPEATGKLPLTYARAWGGPDYAANPLGVGRDSEEMPNFELPSKPVVSRTDQVHPAGFSPIPLDWKYRQQKLGTYNDDWLKSRWPWFPDDFDWSYFNAAPPSQWMERPLVGDEPLEFVNLHPEIPVFRSKLPGVQARCFVTRQVEKAGCFLPVPLTLDTLWASPEEEKLVLVWRGSVPIGHLKLQDVLSMMLLVEPLDQPPRSLEEYAAIQEKILADPEIPETPMPDPAAIQAELDAAVDEWKQWEEEFRSEVNQREDAGKKHIEAQTAKLGQIETGRPVEVPDPFKPQPPVWHDDIADRVRAIETGSQPIDPKVVETASEARQVFDKAKAEAETFDEKYAAAEKEALAAFPAWMTREPPPKEEKIDPGQAASGDFANLTFDGYDFSGLDLRGADFSGCQIRDVTFRGSNLTGARFRLAALERVDLTEAVLDEADFEGAGIVDSPVAGSSWQRTKLLRTNLSGLGFTGCNFANATGENPVFSGADLTGACFRECRLPGALFGSAVLNGADFSDADLTDVDCMGAQGRGIRLTGANLTRFRAGFEADFRDAEILRANGPQSVWKGSRFEGANFQASVLKGAQFSEANLTAACFDRCDLAKATFEDARLEEARLTNANLLEVLFDRADLTRADLGGSNLYGSSFWETNLHQARWERANVKRTKLEVGV